MRIIDTSTLAPTTPLSKSDAEWVYNGLDCCVTLEILDVITAQLDEVTRNTYEFSLALQAPVLDMTMRGLRVNIPLRDKILAGYREQIKFVSGNLDRIIKEGVGVNVNWRSPKQLQALLYDVMGLPKIWKRNAQGRMAPTVNRDAIERLSSYFIAEPICLHLLTLRDLDKKRGFLETSLDPDGRMRCNFNIAGTNTGRLASSVSDFGTGTNQQNVDRDLRAAFCADPGYKFANLDLEQADARNVGAICWNLFVDSNDDKFAGSYLDACESGDLHTTVCRMAWPQLDWTDDPKLNRILADQIAYRNFTYRDMAKRLGHGTNYYGQPPTMAKHSKVPRQQIADFQSAYFSAFPCIPEWHKSVHNTIKQFSFITTTGYQRRRFFFGRYNDDATIREAIAFEPQSMTADEIDTGIINLWRLDRVQLLVQVHDNILFQYREEEEEEIIPLALHALENRIILEKGREFVVPIDAKVGWNWGDCSDENPDGLKKWRGSDSRTREDDAVKKKLSVWNL